MGQNLSPKQAELYQGIDEILWNHWDPIGINVILSARDEYYSYIPGVFKMVMDGAHSLELERHPDDIVKNRMGLKPGRNRLVADRIFELKKQLGL